MSLLEAVILGLIQGVGEFLPISSSGHLVLADLGMKLLGTTQGLGEDRVAVTLALHAATLVAVLVFLRREALEVLVSPRRWPVLGLALAPAVLAFGLAHGAVESAGESPLWIGFGLWITSAFLLSTRGRSDRGGSWRDLHWCTALAVGSAQALALLPGVSRSGSTMAVAILCGLGRRDAAVLSFLLSIPLIAGGVLLEGRDVLRLGATDGALWVGFFTALVLGLVSLRALFRVLASGKLHWFGYYTAAAGALLIALRLVAWKF